MRTRGRAGLLDWQSGAIYGQFWIYPRVRLASYLSSVRFEIWKYLADTADEEGPLPQGEKVMGAAGAQYAGALYTPWHICSCVLYLICACKCDLENGEGRHPM